MKSKTEMISELKTMLHDVFTARRKGEAHPRMARAHGYVDGYMRALIECGISNQKELLTLVADERTTVSGPATLQLQPNTT